MGDMPTSHTTETAPKPDSPERRIYVNCSYVRSLHGILKISHMVVCIIIFICAMASYYPRSDPANWLSFVAMGGFWTSAVLLFLYVINLVTILSIIPWVLLELVYTSIWTFFSFVSGCVAASKSTAGYGAAFAAAAFFSFAAMCVYGFNAFILFKLHREGVRLYTVATVSAPINHPPNTTTMGSATGDGSHRY